MVDPFRRLMTPARLAFLQDALAHGGVIGRNRYSAGWTINDKVYRENLGEWMELHGWIMAVRRPDGNTERMSATLYRYRVTDAGLMAVQRHLGDRTTAITETTENDPGC